MEPDKIVIVDQFGGPEALNVTCQEANRPERGQVRVRITSIGMNHADLMARRGEYKLSSGDPPFTPGIEAGGIIEAVGEGVSENRIGQRVILGADIPRAVDGSGGTYRSAMNVDQTLAIPAPYEIPDNQLGAIWLSYLTAWGCLIWKQQLREGQYVGIPAASSSVGLAAAQVAASVGAIPIGLTSSAEKMETLSTLQCARFSQVILTHDHDRKLLPWHRKVRELTGGNGIDVFFDPVASGAYVEMEIRSLAQDGTIWIYGLLGKPDKVDLSPLIRKRASIRGWILNELASADEEHLQRGYKEVLDGFRSGMFEQHIAREFPLDEVVEAHRFMELGKHIGKLVLVP